MNSYYIALFLERAPMLFNATSLFRVSDSTPPEIVQGLTNYSGEEGRPARFECEITGNPRPEIRWFKGAREITDGGKYSIFSSGDHHTLVVNDLLNEDADDYSCRASNIAGTKSSRAELNIKSAFVYYQ